MIKDKKCEQKTLKIEECRHRIYVDIPFLMCINIKNEYGKINEYKVIENKHKNLNSVEMVFTKNNGLYVGTDNIKYPFKNGIKISSRNRFFAI